MRIGRGDELVEAMVAGRAQAAPRQRAKRRASSA